MGQRALGEYIKAGPTKPLVLTEAHLGNAFHF